MFRQQRQDPPVAEGFQILFCPGQQQPDPRVAPMHRPPEGPEALLEHGMVTQPDQLTQDRQILGLPLFRQHQHRMDHSEHKGHSTPGQNHHPAQRQVVTLSHRRHLLLQLLRGRVALGHLPPQQEPAQQISHQNGQHPRRIAHKQPVRPAPGQAREPGDRRKDPHRLRRPQTGSVPQQPQGLGPQRQRQQRRPVPPARRDHQTDGQHHPHEIPPGGRELLSQHPFHRRHQQPHQRDIGGLQQKTPKIRHRMPPSQTMCRACRRGSSGPSPVCSARPQQKQGGSPPCFLFFHPTRNPAAR